MGAETCERIIAVVLKPSSVAMPAASGPKAGFFTTVLPPVAGSRRKSDGSGMRPAPGSVSTCAVVMGAILKVLITAISLCGKAPSTTRSGKRYVLRISSRAAAFVCISAGVLPGMSVWFSGNLRF